MPGTGSTRHRTFRSYRRRSGRSARARYRATHDRGTLAGRTPGGASRRRWTRMERMRASPASTSRCSNVPSVDDLHVPLSRRSGGRRTLTRRSLTASAWAFTRPSVGVVVQSLLDPDVAGVLFTQNPINKADERMIEASWGLGEVVVAGRRDPGQLPLGSFRHGARTLSRGQKDRNPSRRRWRNSRGESRTGAGRKAVSQRRPACATQHARREVRASI